MKIKVLLKYLFVSALVVLGAGMQEAMASKGRIINANGGGSTEYIFTRWEGRQNGLGVVVEVWPTTTCTGSQGAVPVNGIALNTSAVIFNNGAGVRTWSITQANFLLWEGPAGNGWPILQATMLAGQPVTHCFGTVAPTVNTTLSLQSEMGTQVIPATQVRLGSFNVSGGNKTTLATNVLSTSDGQPVNCSSPPPVQTFRAVVIGSPTLELGLVPGSTIVGTVVNGQDYNVTAKVSGDFWCTNIGQFILSDDIFSGSFEPN